MPRRRSARELVLVLLILVSVGGVPAVVRAAPHTASSQVDGGGVITGRVVDVEGHPVPSVSVGAWPEMGGGVPNASTDSNGVYRIEDLSPGAWRIEFRRGVGTDVWYATDRAYGATSREATPIQVAMGQVVSGIDQRLPLGGTLSGVVVDRNGTGIEGVRMHLHGPAGASTYTGPDGTWQVTGLSPGRYTVQAWPVSTLALAVPAHAPRWYPDAPNELSAAVFDVADGTRHENLRMVLPDLGSIEGRVVDRLGRAASDVCVTATDPYDGLPNPWPASGTTYGDGRIILRTLPPGEYRLEFGACPEGELWAAEVYRDSPRREGATLVTVRAGETTDIGVVTVEVGGAISGRVVVDQSNVLKVPVEAVSVAGLRKVVRVDDTGLYSLRGLAPGPWTVRVVGASYRSATVYHPGVRRADDARPIMVEAGKVSTFDVVIPAPNTVSRRPATPPPNVRVDRRGSTAVIRWDRPVDDGDNLISSYTITNQTAQREMLLVADDTVTRVTNLPSGDAVFTVRTGWEDEPGPPSSGSGSPPPSTTPGPPGMPAGSGYWMLTRDGATYPFGQAGSHGDTATAMAPAGAVDIEAVPGRNGFWLLDRAGRVRAFGDAFELGHHGVAPGDEAVTLSAHPTGRGYWVFTAKGAVMSDGQAPFYGSLSGVPLNGPVRDSVATASGRGYYMVADDGGVFSFGDARFFGSMGATPLNAPVVGLAPTPSGRGYWLVAADGGIFAFGDATFRGSMGGTPLNQPVIGLVPYGDGYVLVARDGGVFNFSSQPFHGSLGDRPPAEPVIGIATLGRT